MISYLLILTEMHIGEHHGCTGSDLQNILVRILAIFIYLLLLLLSILHDMLYSSSSATNYLEIRRCNLCYLSQNLGIFDLISNTRYIFFSYLQYDWKE